MIVHVFTANRYHLVPNISEGFAFLFPNFEHKFILFGSKNIDKNRYESLYKEIGFSSYVFCTSAIEFCNELRKYKKESILFHAGSYSWFLCAIFIGCKNINWICWGAGAALGRSFKSKLIHPIKIYIYNKFRTIVTLMNQDKMSINNDFYVPLHRISVISYASKASVLGTYNDLYKKLMFSEKAIHDKPLIMLGNNPSNVNYYIDIMRLLSCYAGKIRVVCMMNYSLSKNERYYYFLKVGNEIFGADFKSDETLYDFKEYIYYMNACDVYICGAEKQSGLGAITTCLLLGKKIYITGKNYQWIKNKYNAFVGELSDITLNLLFEDFVKELSLEEKIYNHNSVLNHRTLQLDKWNEYLSSIDSKK